MAVAPGIEAQPPFLHRHGEGRGPQPQGLAQIHPGEALPSQLHCLHAVPLREGGRPNPAFSVRAQGNAQSFFQGFPGEAHAVPVVLRSFLSRACHAAQIGHVCAPYRQSVLRPAPGAGEEGGVDERPLIGQHQAVGLPKGGGGPFPVLLGKGCKYPVLAEGLAAGAVRAELAVVFLPVLHGIGPGGHRLGFQGLRLKGDGHFPQEHPLQVGIQGHVITVRQMNGDAAVLPRKGGGPLGQLPHRPHHNQRGQDPYADGLHHLLRKFLHGAFPLPKMNGFMVAQRGRKA